MNFSAARRKAFYKNPRVLDEKNKNNPINGKPSVINYTFNFVSFFFLSVYLILEIFIFFFCL